MSDAWEDAGGTATRYDIRIDPAHNFMEDEKFCDEQEAHPADVYHFAIPCDNFSIAHTTPSKIRNRGRPLGWGPGTATVNRMMRLMIRRVQRFIRAGDCAIIENPLMSYIGRLMR